MTIELINTNVELFPSKADPLRLGYIGRVPTADNKRDSDAWFTPPIYIDSVRAVMKRIDLDPFSSAIANKIVCADNFFSEKKSAFEHDWKIKRSTKVFMNPPYSAGLCGRAINRFLEQYQQKNFTEGIVLVNNATDTKWFNNLAKQCNAICFTDHRISFWNADHKRVSGNTRGQAFFYFGKNIEKFKEIFLSHGFILVPA
ncbi:MAG: DNA N-6-adenine-methyltransferase [Pseudomonadota bacterium]